MKSSNIVSIIYAILNLKFILSCKEFSYYFLFPETLAFIRVCHNDITISQKGSIFVLIRLCDWFS